MRNIFGLSRAKPEQGYLKIQIEPPAMSPLPHNYQEQGHRNQDVGQPLLMNTGPYALKTPSESMRLYDTDPSQQPPNMHIAGVYDIGREQLIHAKGLEHGFIGSEERGHGKNRKGREKEDLKELTRLLGAC